MIQNTRTRRIFEAGFSAIFTKGIILLVNAVSIPITVRYLGAEQFGVWVTISTTLALLVVLDLGIANALTNLISEAYAKENPELAARYATAAFGLMLMVSVVLGVAGLVLWPFISWTSLFHLQGATSATEISHAVATAYTVFLLGLPAGLAAKLLGGYQEIRTANLFATFGSIANLFAVILVTRMHGSLSLLIGTSSGASVLANATCLLWLWFHHKPWLTPHPRHWSSAVARQLMSGGSELFILQLSGLVVFNSDNFVIAHYLGPIDVTPYSITWKLVGYAAALQIVITPALWPAYAEAWIRKDLGWMRRTLRYTMITTLGVAVGCTIVLAFWGRIIIRHWAGPAAVPSETLILLMCLWILISTFCANIATVLTATNATTMQAWLSVVAAVFNLAASIWLVQQIGSVGVILATISSYVIFLIGPQVWKLLQILRPSIVPTEREPPLDTFAQL